MGDAKKKLIFFVEDTAVYFQVIRGNIVRSMKCEERKNCMGASGPIVGVETFVGVLSEALPRRSS